MAVDPAVWRDHIHYQRTADPAALSRLVDEYYPYALSLARGMYREGAALEDLRQVALEALVVALRRFDSERGTPFPAYATPTIIGALKRYFRDQGWALRVPRTVHELAGPMREVVDDLRGRLGRAPAPAQVAAALGVDEDTVRLVDGATRARSSFSLDAPARPDAAAPPEVPVTDPDLVLVDDRVALEAALDGLDARSQRIVRMYYFEDMTQDEIAARYRVSQMQVSRWLRRAVGCLRSRMGVASGDGSGRSRTVAA